MKKLKKEIKEDLVIFLTVGSVVILMGIWYIALTTIFTVYGPINIKIPFHWNRFCITAYDEIKDGKRRSDHYNPITYHPWYNIECKFPESKK